jgi:hypothetical protein
MLLSVVGVALPSLALQVKAAPTDADYTDLANKISHNTVKSIASYATGSPSTDNSITIDDPDGAIYAAMDAYYLIVKGLRNSSPNQNSTDRTINQINNTIKTKIQDKVTDVSESLLTTILSYFVPGPAVSTSNNVGSASVADKKVTLNVPSMVLSYSSLSTLPNSVNTKFVYTYSHDKGNYSQNCNTRYYFRLKEPTKSQTSVSTSKIKDLASVLNANSNIVAAGFNELLAMDSTSLLSVRDAINEKYTALIGETSNYNGPAAYQHYFELDVAELIRTIDAALAISEYVGNAQWLKEQSAVDISNYTYDALSSLYFEMDQKYDDYKAAPAEARNYLEANGYIVIADVEAKLDEIRDAYELIYLRDELAPRIEEDLELYATYDYDWVVGQTPASAETDISAALTELESIRDDLNSRKPANVVTVFGEDYFENTVQPAIDALNDLLEANGLNRRFQEYQATYNQIFKDLTLNESSTELLGILNDQDTWYTELLEFVEELRENNPTLAEKIFTDAEEAMENKINATYAALNAILEVEIEDAWDLYQMQLETYGLAINEVNMSTYNALKTSVGLIEVPVYEFLDETSHFDLSEEAVNKYEELKNIVLALKYYDPSLTLSAYRYNAEELDAIVRLVNEYDVIRDRDYTVQEEFFSDLIDLFDDMLAGGGLADLGVELDLAGTLDGIADKVYTDEFLNKLVGAVYPMMTDLVKENVGGYKDAIGFLETTADDAFMKVNVAFVPVKLSSLIKTYNSSAYSAVTAVLDRASGGVLDDTNAWDNSVLWRNVVDDNGDPVLDDEGQPEKELVLDWGIDAAGATVLASDEENIAGARAARKARFLDAANAALKGLEPALLAMLSNKAVSKTQIAHRSITVIVEVASATAYLTVAANDGYNNTFGPIFEALGCTVADGKTFADSKDIIELGIVEPVHELFENLKTAPVDTVLGLLPSLAFAVQNGLVLPLLHNLLINMSLDIDLTGAASWFSGCVPGNSQFNIDLGDPEVLNLADILGIETFYDDVTTMDGVLNLVLGLLAGDEEEPAEGEEPAPELRLPEMDGAKLAMLGTDVAWADSYRSVSQISYEDRTNIHANIIANKPQVMQFLVEYLLQAIQDDDFLPALLNMINKDKEEDEQVTLPEIVDTILTNVKLNGTDAIAAVAEMMYPVDPRYTMPDKIQWITEGNIVEEAYDIWTVSDPELTGTPWAKEDAKYAVSHLSELLDSIVELVTGLTATEEDLGPFGGATNFGDAIGYFVNDLLFTSDLVNTLAETFRNLVKGTGEEDEEGNVDNGLLGKLPEALQNLNLIEQLGIDVNAWDNLSYEFQNGNATAFKNALIEILNPLNDLLAFLLTEKGDIELEVFGLTFKALSYEGYSYGIVPLLEALGCEVTPSNEFNAHPDKVVENIVNSVFTIVDSILDDPLGYIEKTVPALIYFDATGALPVSISHLKTAVTVLLDIIRPIYSVNVDELFVGMEFDLNSLATNPLEFVMTKAIDIIYNKTGIKLSNDFTLQSLAQTLHYTDPIPFDSANGDTAYTVELSENGKAELFARFCDYLIGQIAMDENQAKITELLSGLGLDGTVKDIIDQVMVNLVENYPASVLSIFQVVYPRVTDRKDDELTEVQDIDWITGTYTASEGYWSVEDPAYVGVTPWTQDKGVFMANHLPEVIQNVLILLEDQLETTDLGDLVEGLLVNLFTADNANAIVDKINELLGNLELPDVVKDLGVLEQLGLDPDNWAEMSFEFEDGNVDAFRDALIEIASPLKGLLAFLLAEGSLTAAEGNAHGEPVYGELGDIQIILKDALPIRALGYDGYAYGIVPILEALGANGVLTPADFKADKSHVIENIVYPLFSVIDKICDDPLGYLEAVVPELLYFDDVKVLSAAIPNLLYSVTVLIDTIQPLYDTDLYKLVAMLTATEDNPEGFDLTLSDFSVTETLLGLLPGLIENALEIDLDDIATGDLIGYISYTTTEFNSVNGDTAYRAVLAGDSKAVLLTTLLDYVIAQLKKEDNIAMLKAKLAGFELDESVMTIVDQVIENLINNYTDSVFALFQLMYPRVKDREDAKLRTVQVIEWSSDPHASVAPEEYWEVKTLWTQEQGEFMAKHLPDVVQNVLKLVGSPEDPSAAIKGALANLFTDENANMIKDKIAELLGSIELPAAVSDMIDLADLGLDATVWANMSFSFTNGNTEAFKAALIQILQPLTPVLSFLLAEGTLAPLDNLGDPPYGAAGNLEVKIKDTLPIRGLGYDGYSYGIVPILEALGADGIMSPAEFKSENNKNLVVKNIINPLFTVIDKLAADPLGFIDSILPELLYFDEVGVLQTAVKNLLFSVTVLLDTLQPLYAVDLYDLVKQFTATEETPEGFDLTFSDFSVTEKLVGLLPGLAESALGLDLDPIDLDELKTRIAYTPVEFTSANGDAAYRAVLDDENKAVLLTSALDYVYRQLGKEANEAKVKELLAGLGLGEGASEIVDTVYANLINNYTASVFALFQLMYPRVADRREADLDEIQKIDWITEGNVGADEEYIGTPLPEGETTLWTTEKAVYMAEHLGDFLNDVAVIFGEQLGGAETVEDAVNYLVKDLFTAENANAIKDAIPSFINSLELPEAINDLGVLEQLGLDPANWENMPSFSFADGDRTAFKNALIKILKPLEPVLAFLLADATLTPVDELGDPPYGKAGNLEVKLKDALPVRALGYDGYSYGIVPLLEALGASDLKTTDQFKADKNNVVKNIVDPLFTVVDHLIQNPVKFLEDVIPAILYFDKVGGIQVAAKNLLFAVNVLIDTIQPLYEIDLYTLVEEKTGIDLTFSDVSPVDFILDKVTEALEEGTGIVVDLGTAEELTEELHFTDPQKFTSANGDDAYTIRLTDQGKADLLSRILDYAVNEVIFEDNFEKLSEIFKSLIKDDDARAILMGILRIMKDADRDIADFHGVHDVALASLFWVFFGADSVTDAVSDFFYRYKDAEWYEIVFRVGDKVPAYIDRAAFLITEAYTVEYPAFQKILEEREALLKPPYEYTEEETQMAAGIGARIIRFFALIIAFFKNIFKR